MSEAIDEIRAILRDFCQSPWRDLFVRTGDWQLFLVRPGGGLNPIQAHVRDDHTGAQLAMAVNDSVVTAPHLGLFIPDCQADVKVKEGAIIGSIRALDRDTPVFAAVEGAVDWLAGDNEFVEFGAALAEIGALSN